MVALRTHYQMEQATHYSKVQSVAKLSVIDDLHGTRQYFPTFTQASLKPSTKFFSTVLIDPDDHKLMAMIRLTTKCDGKARKRSSLASASTIACSIAADGIAASSGFKYRTGFDDRRYQGEFFELHISCDRTLGTMVSLPYFGLNLTVLASILSRFCLHPRIVDCLNLLKPRLSRFGRFLSSGSVEER